MQSEDVRVIRDDKGRLFKVRKFIPEKRPRLMVQELNQDYTPIAGEFHAVMIPEGRVVQYRSAFRISSHQECVLHCYDYRGEEKLMIDVLKIPRGSCVVSASSKSAISGPCEDITPIWKGGER